MATHRIVRQGDGYRIETVAASGRHWLLRRIFAKHGEWRCGESDCCEALDAVHRDACGFHGNLWCYFVFFSFTTCTPWGLILET